MSKLFFTMELATTKQSLIEHTIIIIHLFSEWFRSKAFLQLSKHVGYANVFSKPNPLFPAIFVDEKLTLAIQIAWHWGFRVCFMYLMYGSWRHTIISRGQMIWHVPCWTLLRKLLGWGVKLWCGMMILYILRKWGITNTLCQKRKHALSVSSS